MRRASRRNKGPGPAPFETQRKEYARLRQQGVSNAEACRIVGINRRTGSRWLYGRSIPRATGGELHYPPVINQRQPVRSPRFLSAEERDLISDRRRDGISMRAIAFELGRAASTISREIARNSDAAGRYRPAAAQRLATGRLPRARPRRLATDPVLRDAVQGMLDQAWSPEQISQTLHARFPEEPTRQLCHESIYQAIYDRHSALGANRCAALRTGRRRRRPHRRGDARTPRSLRDMTPISQRPAEAADRVQAGHWEGDLITGVANRSAIGTLVERTTRYTVLVHLPDSHTASATRDAVIEAMAQVPRSSAAA